MSPPAEEHPTRKAESLVRKYATKEPEPSYSFRLSPTYSKREEERSSKHGRSPIRHRKMPPKELASSSNFYERRHHHRSPSSTSSSPRKKENSKKQIFKAGDKDIKFQTYNGKRDVTKALSFIRQFEVAFVEEDFREKSKLRHVGMYLKDMASDWWLTKILEGKHAKTWKEFKVQIFEQFLPPDFEKDVRKEWD